MVDGPKRTMMAQQALALSDLLNMRFKGAWVGTETPKHIVVQAPEETTDGGKRARQSITLAPASGTLGTVMVGWLDVTQKKAELRTHAVVAQHYQQRYHRAFDVARDPYDRTMREVQALVSMQGLAVTVEEVPHAPPIAPKPVAPVKTGPSAIVLLFAVLTLLAAAALGVYVVLLR